MHDIIQHTALMTSNCADEQDEVVCPRVPAFKDCKEFEECQDFEEDKFYDIWDMMPEADSDGKTTETKKEDNDWLTDDIREEVKKLEQLAQQLDKVVKPVMKAKPEQLEWEMQEIEKFRVELKPLKTAAAKQSKKSPRKTGNKCCINYYSQKKHSKYYPPQTVTTCSRQKQEHVRSPRVKIVVPLNRI